MFDFSNKVIFTLIKPCSKKELDEFKSKHADCKFIETVNEWIAYYE